MEYPRTKKFFVRLEEIAVALYYPPEEPSFGIFYPAHIDIILKNGAKLTIPQDNEKFEEFMEMLF